MSIFLVADTSLHVINFPYFEHLKALTIALVLAAAY